MKKKFIKEDVCLKFKKLLLTMKLSIVLLIAGIVTVNAKSSYSQNTNFNLKLSNVQLKEVFSEIESSSEFIFFYYDEAVDVNRKVNIDVANKNIHEILKELFQSTNTAYEVIDRQIILFNVKTLEPEMPKSDFPIDLELAKQEFIIKGKVSDAKGNTLPGVNVVEKGTTNGTITNLDGEYSISVSSTDAILSFSYVGFLTEEVSVGGQTTINLIMVEDIQSLDEVVVVGYGSQKRKDLTGAVTSVNTDNSGDSPIGNLAQILQGQAAGVLVTSNSGAPGAGISVNIRGLNSFLNNQPLYVIDGVPFNDFQPELVTDLREGYYRKFSPLAALNTDDIESIDILKDASATAIYGVRAANGVVQITTKRGKIDKTSTTFDAYFGWQSPQKKVDMLNARQFADYLTELYEGTDAPSVEPIDQLANQYNTDWQNEIFDESAPIQSYQLRTNSGTEKLRYSLSGSYFGQQGIIVKSGFKRYNLRANIDNYPTKWLKLGANLNLSRTDNDEIVTDNIYLSPTTLALQNQPTLQPGKISEGVWHGAEGGIYGDTRNPLAILNEEKRNNLQNMFFGNVFAEIKFIDGLTLRSSLAESYTYDMYSTWVPHYEAGINGNFGTGSRGETNIYNTNTVFDNTLTFSRLLGVHSFTVLAGSSTEIGKYHFFTGGTNGYTGNEKPDFGMGDLLSEQRMLNGANAKTTTVSFFGRINYAYMGKYLFAGTLRRDASSKFGKGYQWGSFPSGSIGWIISEEEIMKGIDAIDYFKIRASYGLTGNHKIPSDVHFPAIIGGSGPDTQYSIGYTTRDGSYNAVQNVTSGKTFAGIPNRGITWETTKQWNVGADIIMVDRLSMNIEYYSKLTKDLLLNRPVPINTGFGASYVNFGEVSNKGVEISLTSDNLGSEGELKWTTNFNIAFNKNEVLSLPDGVTDVSSNHTRTEVGQPIGQFYGLEIEGVFQTDEEAMIVNGEGNRIYPNASAGDLKWKDQNGDGVIDEKDRAFLGSPHPKFFYGFTNSLSFKGIELNLVLQGVKGNSIYYELGDIIERMDGYYNQSTRILDRWTSTNPSNDMPRAVVGDPNQNRRENTSRWIEDGSYLRIKNITLAYTLPMKMNGISMARIYTTIANAYSFTKYPGYDPEVGNINGGNALSAGVDAGRYPVARSLTVGLNLAF